MKQNCRTQGQDPSFHIDQTFGQQQKLHSEKKRVKRAQRNRTEFHASYRKKWRYMLKLLKKIVPKIQF